MNQVALVGNITDDPELRYTQSGAALAGFTVAVSHRSKHNGEWQDVHDGFFRCTAWRLVAENAAQTLHKGDRVMVIGKLVQRNFETDGQKRSVIEIQVTHVSSVRHRRGSQVHRRGFPGPCGGRRVIPSSPGTSGARLRPGSSALVGLELTPSVTKRPKSVFGQVGGGQCEQCPRQDRRPTAVSHSPQRSRALAQWTHTSPPFAAS